jgi:hypothetical protein
MPRRRIGLLALAVLTVGMALPSVVVANTGFTATADRSGVLQGAPTIVRVTIRPDVQADVDNLCYLFGIPSAFTILSATIAVRPPGSNWAAVLHAGSLQLRSNGDSVIESTEQLTAAISVRGNTAGSYIWTIGGYDKNVCQTGTLKEQRSLGMAITAASTPTPSPSPQPTPTPRPTQAASSQPQPPASQGPAPSSPSGQAPNATPPPAPGVSPGFSPSSPPQPPAPDGDRPTAAGPDPLDGDSQGGATQPGRMGSAQLVTIPFGDGRDDAASMDAQLSSAVLSAMAMLDNPFEWFVPGATLGVPAILILVVLGLQLVAGVIWAPALRRMTDDDRPRRRPLRPGWLRPPAR